MEIILLIGTHPISTFGRGGVYKKGGLYSSVDKLIDGAPSSYDIKINHNQVNILAETEVTDTPLPIQRIPSKKQELEMDSTNNGSSTPGMTSDNSLKVTGKDHNSD